MAVIGIVNSDPEVKKLVDAAMAEDISRNYEARYFSRDNEILDYLGSDLPELVVINFSDPAISIDRLVSYIYADKQIFDFGIIGIFDSEKDDKETLNTKYKFVNVITLLDTCRLRGYLIKSISIIEQNYQILFQREFSKNLPEGASGSFIIENDILAVPLYSGIAATILSQRGLLNPDHKMQLQIVLGELIVNAVEHGNCGISHDEKTTGMEKGLSVAELVNERCKDPLIRKKKAEFFWDIQSDKTVFVIRDEGSGFDAKDHLRKVASQDKVSLHGQGIRMASALSTDLQYNDKGNQVTLTLVHDSSIERQIPRGFSKEQVLDVGKGDIVLREGEHSDCLYYIISGNYSIFHNLKKVGSLSAQDIFMGEIAFLLNQRRSASVRADSPGRLVRITRRSLVQVIRDYPYYGIYLFKLMARRLVHANEQAAKLTEIIKRKSN